MRRRPCAAAENRGVPFMSARVLRGATMVVAGLTSVMRLPALTASAATATGPAVTSPRTGLRGPRTTTPAAPPRTVRDEAALSRGQRVIYWALTALWAVVVLQFWRWWLAPEHHGALGLYVATSLPLAYLTTVLPSFYWFFVGRMRRPVHQEPAPGRRVALITLCVPSHETLDVIADQLRALTQVRYPHDSWVLDEGADPEIEALAAELGVRYFTRKGKPLWNQPGPPFQAKTKAGNVNAWLDFVEMEGLDYDVFVQLDIDHHPAPEYLDRTLGYFDDPEVAWVQAPSVCGNLDSWTARGLAEQDLVLQGPLQMGFYGHSRTPFIIGSHTSYRTVGDPLDRRLPADARGGPPRHGRARRRRLHRASTSRRSSPRATGPRTSAPTSASSSPGRTRWCRSSSGTRRASCGATRPRRRSSSSWRRAGTRSGRCRSAVLWVLPMVALLSGHRIADVPLTAVPRLQRRDGPVLERSCGGGAAAGSSRPGSASPGAALVLEMARWPIVLWAVINVLLRIQRPYMITPKGDRGADALASGRRLYGPHVMLAALSIAAVAAFVLVVGHASTQGYLVLVLFNAITVLGLLVTVLGARAPRPAPPHRAPAAARCACGPARPPSSSLTTVGVVAAVLAAWAPMAEAVR